MTLAVVIACAFATPAMSNPTSPTGPTTNVGQPLTIESCTVPAKVYNRHVRKLNALKGKKVRRGVHHRIACAKFRAVKRHIKRARADCLRNAQTTEASVYWPGADSGGMIGSCGWYLGNFTYAYAELGMGTYLGGLRCGQTLYMHGPNGKTVHGPKVDIGFGSGSTRRGIDLWNRTGPALGISGIGTVRVSTRNCWA